LSSVSEPTTVDEVARAMRAATAAGERVSIGRGGGDVELSLGQLDRVLAHEAGDLTVTVEAGIRLSALRARLAPHGQELALDPPGDPTVGGCLAGDLSGPRRHRFGAPRDLLLGVTLVLADGTVANAGGTVVKNVAGYDLGKLVCGSAGRYAAIARASLRLHPLPSATASVVVDVDEPDDASRLARIVAHSALIPTACDLEWPGRLLLRFEGGEAGVSAQVARAADILGAHPIDDLVWDEVREVQASLPGRISYPPGKLAAFLAREPSGLVRVGVGSAHVPYQPEEARSPGAQRLAERVRAALDPLEVLV
jgi:glycolate dehydrogenase FAD-binding subunit